MANRRNAVYALLIIALLGGLFRSFLFNLAYVLVLLLAGSFIWSWLAVNWVRIGRQTYAQRAQVGRYFDEHFRVHNTGFFPKLWLEVRDQSTLPGHHASHIVPTMLPRRKYRWEVHTLCTQRGQFILGPLTINSGDPFGFYQFPRHIRATSRVIVYPATVPVYDFASPIGRLTGGQAVQRRTYEVTTNAAGIREYTPGDSLNRIHWKTTARRGKLYTKEFELDPLSDVWIFVDFDRSAMYAAQGLRDMPVADGTWQLPSNTEEYIVTCAASVSEYYIEKGRAVGLICYTPHRKIVQPDRGDRQQSRVLEELALARSETSVTLRQMLAIDGELAGRGNTIVIVTSSLDFGWITVAETLRRRGLYVVAVIVDPTSFGATGMSFTDIHAAAEGANIRVYPVKLYDDLTQALSFTPMPTKV